MRIGVLIIGSLLWEQTPTRNRWRDDRLSLDRKTKVFVPIKYGRLSGEQRGHCYTMVFERNRVDRLGSAWVVPATQDATSVEDLLEEAAALANAEGMASACTSWSVIGLWVRPGLLGADQVAAWRDGVTTNRERFDKLRRTCPLGADGLVDLSWPLFEHEERAADFDAILATFTDPTSGGEDAPRPEDVAAKMRDDETGRGRMYFLGNRSVGITTFQDLAILDELRRDTSLANVNAAALVEQETEVWTYLDRFLGYGRRDPRFLFVGLEERTEQDDEERVLRARLLRPEIFGGARGDKNQALMALYPDRRAEEVPQWTVAAAIVAEVRRLLGEAPTENELQALGTDAGDAFLGELLPVARSGGSKFPLRRFSIKGETAYHRKSLGRNAAGRRNKGGPLLERWTGLENLVRGHDRPPEFIVCYGWTWRRVYEQLVAPWQGEPQEDIAGGKIWRVGTSSSGSAVAITGFFRERERHATDITSEDVGMIARRLVDAARGGAVSPTRP